MCRKYDAMSKARVLEAYRHRNIILPRIDWRRQRVARHVRVTYRLMWKGWKEMVKIDPANLIA
jgi:hypothetical protein